ncbi:hypothetical protein F4780DRAFT_314548 [Xylariomycetidae sp. FL0641]|nr:hypothetical protein F4780DRAFT_314548 [Xylariomycetidae sp. FL0641]
MDELEKKKWDNEHTLRARSVYLIVPPSDQSCVGHDPADKGKDINDSSVNPSASCATPLPIFTNLCQGLWSLVITGEPAAKVESGMTAERVETGVRITITRTNQPDTSGYGSNGEELKELRFKLVDERWNVYMAPKGSTPCHLTYTHGLCNWRVEFRKLGERLVKNGSASIDGKEHALNSKTFCLGIISSKGWAGERRLKDVRKWVEALEEKNPGERTEPQGPDSAEADPREDVATDDGPQTQKHADTQGRSSWTLAVLTGRK